jgi:alkaline phosphatase D
MPIREPAAGTLPEASWRRFQFGDVATLLMTETRLTARSHQLDYGRDLPVKDGKPDFAAFAVKLGPRSPDDGPGPGAVAGPRGRRLDEGRHGLAGAGQPGGDGPGGQPDLKATMGDAAYAALLAKLPEYVAKPVEQARALSQVGVPGNLDAWDGYPADRARVYDIFKAGKARPIVLAGDSHAFWANELWDDAGVHPRGGRVRRHLGDLARLWRLPARRADRPGLRRPQQGGEVHRPGAKGYPAADPGARPATGELVAVSTILDPTYQTRVFKRFVVTPGMAAG